MTSRKTESKINAKAKFSVIARVAKSTQSLANVFAFAPTPAMAYATAN